VNPVRIRRGFTLLETLVAAAVFILLVTVLWRIWTGISRGAEKSGERASAEVKASLALEKLKNELLDRVKPGFQEDPLDIPPLSGVDGTTRTVVLHRRNERVFNYTSGTAELPGGSGEKLVFAFDTEIPVVPAEDETAAAGGSSWQVEAFLVKDTQRRSADLVLKETVPGASEEMQRVVLKNIYSVHTTVEEVELSSGENLVSLPSRTKVTFTLRFESPDHRRWPGNWESMSYNEQQVEIAKRSFIMNITIVLPVKAVTYAGGGAGS